MKNIFKNSNLIIYLIGIFVSGIGTKLTTIALADKVINFSGNDFNVSLVYIIQSLPVLILGMLAGNVVDKKDKKKFFIAINVICSFISFMYAFNDDKVIIFTVILFNGIVQAFYIPLITSMMPLVVEKNQLTEANGLKMSVNGIIMVAGYAFAGVLISFTGNTIAFILDGLSFIFIAITSCFLRVSQEKEVSDLNIKTNIREEMIEGWHFIRNNAQIRHLFIIDITITLIISMQAPLTYVFVEKYLGGNSFMARGAGLLFAAAGIGTIFGGILLGKFKNKNKLRLLLVSLVLDSMVVIIFSLNRNFLISLILYGGMGVVGGFNGGVLQTVIQERTPEKLIGRVSGVINSVVEPISVLSLLIGGISSNFIEVKWIFIIGALVELITVSYFIRKYRISIFKKTTFNA